MASSITGVMLPGRPAGSLWDVSFSPASIVSIRPHAASAPQSGRRPALFPALAHPHVHLDKAFMHLSPDYAHLVPRTGTFAEAVSNTAQAKSGFTLPDLLERGRWLLDESVDHGVTAMRAFVEVDATVKHLCLDAAIRLKEEWRGRCHVQIVCFAQDPIFSGPHGDENRTLVEEALQRAEVDVVGTTPYVESDREASRQNIEWAVRTALRSGKHLDFHLDYDLDARREPMIWHVIETLKAHSWPSRTGKRVMVGHATRLGLFSHAEWQRLARHIADARLPLTFVGLPTSDLYMASAPDTGQSGQPRGTLPVCSMIRDHGLDAVVGINNVGNAFTPWGGCDPLALASLCVGLYQAGTRDDAELLFECVSSRARAAMGLGGASATVSEGDAAELLVVGDMRSGRAAVSDLVWSPSMARKRHVVFRGRLSLALLPDGG